MNEVEEYYLQHVGVKGMKWGVRKKRNSGPKQTRAERKTAKKSNKQAKSQKKLTARQAAVRAKQKQGLSRGDKVGLAALVLIGAKFGPVPLATASAIATYDILKYGKNSPYNTVANNPEHAKAAKKIVSDAGKG